ncbi:MAG: O-antigen ligase family protein [Planctomycetota bacterium]
MALGAAVAAGVLAGAVPALGALVAVGAWGALALAWRPDLAAPAVAFLLWANVPVVAMRDHGVPKTIASAYLLLLLLPIVRSVARRGAGRAEDGLRAPVGLPWALAFMAFSLLSAAFARDPARAIEGAKEYGLEGGVVFVLTGFAIQGTNTLRNVARGLVAAGAFMGAVALLQQITGRFDSTFGGFALVDSGFTAGEVTQPRLAGPIGEKNRFGQAMLVAAGLGVGLARAETSRTLRTVALVAAGLSLAGGALTFSRGFAVAAAALTVVMGAFGMVRLRALVPMAVVGAALLLALPQYRARLATVVDVLALTGPRASATKPDNAILGRATEVIAAVLVYVDHPVLGVGPSLFSSYSQEYGNSLGLRRLRTEREAHMLFPHIAAEGGTLGLGAFGLLLAAVMHRLWLLSRRAETEVERELARGYFSALVAYLLCGLFLHMAFVRYFWFLVAASAAMAARPLRAPESATSGPAPGGPRPLGASVGGAV